MPLTIAPLGVRCNIQCRYCYEDPMRDAGNLGVRYSRSDLESLKRSIARHSRGDEPFLLFGGEPLLLPKRVLEELLEWGPKRSGRNSIQTNGVLIDDEHIELFKRYRINVGVSIDVPGELNDALGPHPLAYARVNGSQRARDREAACERPAMRSDRHIASPQRQPRPAGKAHRLVPRTGTPGGATRQPPHARDRE